MRIMALVQRYDERSAEMAICIQRSFELLQQRIGKPVNVAVLFLTYRIDIMGFLLGRLADRGDL